MPGARWSAALVAVWLLRGSLALAQDSGVVAGRVTAADGGAPVAAEVVLDGVRSARAGADGRWRMDGVAEGRHRIRVRAPGFLPLERDVDVVANRTAMADASLDVAIVPLNAVVVTAARREQRLADAVVETELIDRAEIVQSGSSNLVDVLTSRAGVDLNGGVPAGAGIQIRGLDSRRVLVLMDGQPVAGRINGNFDLARVPSAAVERIEIVKGPLSTLYGSEAMGGVVNIVTRRPPEDVGFAGALTLTGGSNGRRDVAGEAGIRGGAIGLQATAGRRSIDLVPGLAGDAATFARQWDGRASLRWGDLRGTWAEVTASGTAERQRYRTGQLFNFVDNTQIDAMLKSAASVMAGRLSATGSLSGFSHLSRASTMSQPVSDSGARDRQRLLRASLLYNRLVGASAIDVGLDLTREALDADRVHAPDRATVTSEPYLQLTHSWSDLTLTPGVRITASDRWGEFVAPAVAALWRAAPSIVVRASLGRGFRAPDFKELYLDFVNSAVGYAVKGNADLRPESSTSGSIGAEWSAPSRYGRMTAHRQQYHDFIETGEPDAGGTYTYRNVARGSSWGVELEAGMFAGSWRFDGTYGYLRARDLTTGTPLLGRPPHRSTFTAKPPAMWGTRVSVSGSYLSATPIDRGAGGELTTRKEFTRVDARATRRLMSVVDVSIGVDNLLDRRLGAAWPGFTGRQFQVSIAWRRGVE
ncbi:MAG: Vitamin B12 transporter BtuB [Gemmatimonadaceae bacterium]|nr:Vitamin B12 transporter BtuB [Gemmatimonadaceae bacterium]